MYDDIKNKNRIEIKLPCYFAEGYQGKQIISSKSKSQINMIILHANYTNKVMIKDVHDNKKLTIEVF